MEIDAQSTKRLFAKSIPRDGNPRDGCYLVTHTADVMEAAKLLFETVGGDLQRFFKLSNEQMPCLLSTVQLAAFCHDIGKANDGFQKMITNGVRDQTIRHEHLSALLMSLEDVRQWLSNFPLADFELARLIVLGHHLKADKDENVATKDRRIPVFASSRNGDDCFVLYSDCKTHPDFTKVFDCLRSLSPEMHEPSFSIPTNWSFYGYEADVCIAPLRDASIQEFEELVVQLRKHESRHRLLWAAKAIFFAADAVASGIRRKEIAISAKTDVRATRIGDWIKTLEGGKTSSDIDRLIDKRKEEVKNRERKKGNLGFVFIENDFQQQMHRLDERALLLAPCGSGKTLAAYLWIKNQLASRSGWKVIFLYPTTGTATEGFKDYASHDEDAALIHSRAVFDLEGMFENPDERSKNDYAVDQRLYALGYWPDAIFSATADSFLSFLQNSYSSLCLLPVLARSVIVIDEIHSFDGAMFDALIEFLDKFKAPVLLMTASLQEHRLEILQRRFPSLDVFPKSKADVKRLSKSADVDRYRIKRLDPKWSEQEVYKVRGEPLCPAQLIRIAQDEYDKNFKILWVVNTVDRCIEVARQLKRANLFCYHSRFEYADRRDRHRDVVNEFQTTDLRGAIAVTTQVCEMSLDLDADVLMTELCPAPSLVQRMGRCNRSIAGREPESHGRVYIYEPIGVLPYTQEALQSGRELLDQLDQTTAIKQSDLSSAMKSITLSKDRGKRCLFTMPMWEAYSDDFRDIDEFAVSAVRQSQLKKFRELTRKRDRKSAGLILPAPRRFCMKDKPSDIWLAVVPDDTKREEIEYTKQFGLRCRN